MIWCDHMYIGKKCRAGYKRLKYRISNRLTHPCVFLIVLPRSGHGVLEIIPSLLLLQKNYPQEELCIVGMAATRREAFSLAGTMVAESFASRGDADIGAYMELIQTRGCEA